MAQVAYEKPPSRIGGQSQLPEIKHPLSRLDLNVNNLELRGYSRDGRYSYYQSGRPLSQETGGDFIGAKRRSSTYVNDLPNKARQIGGDIVLPPVYESSIPQNVEVMRGDPKKTKLPIFGNKSSLSYREDVQSRVGSRYSNRTLSRLSTSSITQRLQTDENEMLLREKIKTNYQEIKHLFKENDPEQNGILDRATFCRVINQILNKPLSHAQLTPLIYRLGFGEREVISFTDFYAVLRDSASNEQMAPWMDPAERSDWNHMYSAAQVHARLKAMITVRHDELHQLLYNHSANGRILRSQLLDVLQELSLRMKQSEFEKLWLKYDKSSSGSVNVATILSTLTTSTNEADQAATGNGGGIRKNEVDRQRSLNIERWLKDKFREGYLSMKTTFEKADEGHSGKVSHDAFLAVLAGHGLKLEKHFLNDFLNRCQIEDFKDGVPYQDFLKYFQDRTDQGAAHRILNNSKHKYNRPSSPSALSTISSLEAQLINMFQRDFLALLATLEKVDRNHNGCVSQEEFRAAIESRTGLELTDDQFSTFVDRLPLDADGNVKYAEFMAQFDAGKSRSLHLGEITNTSSVIFDDTENSYEKPKRSVNEIRLIIRQLVKTSLAALEKAFSEVDKQSSGCLKPETAVELLGRMNIAQPITHAEMRELWPSLIHNANGTVSWLEFIRYFGYSLASASYPNAKLRPPRRGDADFMQRSRHLNNESDMIHDTLYTKIRHLSEDLEREFSILDPYHTGCVAADEFKDILSELCVQLSEQELNELSKKYTTGDGRVSYERFLKPFVDKVRPLWRQSNNVAGLMNHFPEEGEQFNTSSSMQMNDMIAVGGSLKLRLRLHRKLITRWKDLKRAFRKLDPTRIGYVTTTAFKATLGELGVTLNDEEEYGLLTSYDSDVTGKIAYNKFLSDLTQDKIQGGFLSKSAML